MRHHKYNLLEGGATAGHNEDTQHHENHLYAMKSHVHPEVKRSTNWRHPLNKPTLKHSVIQWAAKDVKKRPIPQFYDDSQDVFHA